MVDSSESNLMTATLVELSVTGVVAELEFSPDASILVAKDGHGLVLGAWQIR